jgi:hypothetical protein
MKSLKDANAPVVSKGMVLTIVKVLLDHTKFYLCNASCVALVLIYY